MAVPPVRPRRPAVALIDTPRLHLRRPEPRDLQPIFDRYASSDAATRYVVWPRHTSLDDTRAFLAFSDSEWARWNAGPLLVFARDDGRMLGGTGLALESATVATTGYIFAPQEWAHGYATEALHAMVEWARSLGLTRVHAGVHVDHRPSQRVLEKGGFTREGIAAKATIFPNLSAEPQDVVGYARMLNA